MLGADALGVRDGRPAPAGGDDQSGAPPLRDGLWAKARGPTGSRPPSGGICTGDGHNRPQSSRTSGGRRRAGAGGATGTSGHAAHTPPSAPGPWPGSWPAVWGPWPPRFREPPQATGALAPAPRTQKVSTVPRHRRRPGVVAPSVACRGLEKDTRAESEAGPRRRHGGGEPTHGAQQEQPSSLPGAGSAEAPRCKKQSEDLKKSVANS